MSYLSHRWISTEPRLFILKLWNVRCFATKIQWKLKIRIFDPNLHFCSFLKILFSAKWYLCAWEVTYMIYHISNWILDFFWKLSQYFLIFFLVSYIEHFPLSWLSVSQVVKVQERVVYFLLTLLPANRKSKLFRTLRRTTLRYRILKFFFNNLGLLRYMKYWILWNKILCINFKKYEKD